MQNISIKLKFQEVEAISCKQQVKSWLCCQPWHCIASEQNTVQKCFFQVCKWNCKQTRKNPVADSLSWSTLWIWQTMNLSEFVWWDFFWEDCTMRDGQLWEGNWLHEFPVQRQNTLRECLKLTDTCQACGSWKSALSIAGKEDVAAARCHLYLLPCLFLSVSVLQKSYIHQCRWMEFLKSILFCCISKSAAF